MKRLLYGTSILALIAVQPAIAQDSAKPTEAKAAAENVTVLSQWRYDPLYTSGISVERILDFTVVIGAADNEIGDVENLIFSNSGEVLAAITEIGGFLDIGDTHIAVPWDQVELSEDGMQMTVPVTEESVEDFSIFGPDESFYKFDAESVAAVDDDLRAGPSVFKATDLVGNYAFLTSDVPYGYVSDLVIDRTDDTVKAVVVESSGYGMPGYYAYPYRRGDRRPDQPRYDLPYSDKEIDTIEQFDYRRMQQGQG